MDSFPDTATKCPSRYRQLCPERKIHTFYIDNFAALQLVQWKEPKKSAAAFGFSMLVLVSVATLSVISVVSYLLLACLCVSITFR